MGEMKLQQALDEFKTIYLPARNYAFRTRKEYANDLRELVEFIEKMGIIRVGDIALNHLERYLAYLDQKGYAGATRKRKTVAIRTFFGFLTQEGYVSNDLSRRLITPYAENKLPRVLTRAEYQRLIDACASNPRDIAIVVLLLQTGIRLSELVRLKLADIELPEGDIADQDFGQLRILGGGGRKDRVMPLNSKACQALRDYLKAQPDQQFHSLFHNKDGSVLGPRGIQKMLHKYFTQTGIKAASVHTIRHTFGTHHAAKGTNIKTIQEVMGHRDVRNTEIYLSLAKELHRKDLGKNAL
jgi:site-specific recombinase XerD